MRSCIASLAIVLALGSFGCRSVPRSPYYDSLLEFASPQGLAIPETDFHDNVEYATYLDFTNSLEEVWVACLEIALQGGGILAMESEGESRSLVVVNTGEVGEGGSLVDRVEHEQFTRRADVWVSLKLAVIEGGRCRLSAAWLSPLTHQTVRVARTGDDEIRLRRQCVKEFLDAVRDQIEGPPSWRNRLLQEPIAARPDPPRTLDWERPQVDEFNRDLGRRFGNRAVASFLSDAFEIRAPRIEQHIETIASRILEASGSTHVVAGEAIIFSSVAYVAMAFPNGDIAISSSLLNQVGDNDELAFVIAHELDHVIHEDTIERYESAYHWFLFRIILGAALEIAAGFMLGLFETDPESASPDDLMSFEEALGGAFIIAGGLLGSGLLGSGVGWGMGMATISVFSVEQELRADANAARYCWLAGFDPRAGLEVINHGHFSLGEGPEKSQ